MPDLFSGVRVGIDVGGTKTHLRAVRGGQVLADRVVSSEGWRPADAASAAAFLTDLIATTLPDAAVDAVAVGAHGCDSSRACDALATELVRRLPAAKCLVRNDAELLVPACGLAAGVGVVAGTGSVAVARDRRGEPVFMGGWGWLIGDEGSAPGLLREAVRASMAARDRGEPPDLLATALMGSYGVGEVADLPEAMAGEAGAASWGRRAELVFEALHGGSALARAVVDDAADALASLVTGMAGRDVDVDDVVVAGGVILNQPSLFDAFARKLAAVAPVSTVHRLTVDPVVGAVRLAECLVAS
ncbi:N-acetylglucosamine kinase [Kutzneria kofuensis]|uniref:N-acetylglucosamine kinase-like BadF-type ATPase n=1 Tax=Kutzneria kofuensis TaxID=103725 RepID=A0A7W9KSG5_9PSEU|nr:BadF/BadG/BcrA/BcrD ATPase family protein [Kutzneria kofuensis]MBB5897872.1 N-acetylglucosamine kinase-like BadF-type ATPase [Kutzneria kofuensis]